MSEHKFEPFDRVLVRDGILTAWVPAFFASILPGVQPRYETISGVGYLRCIPYTPETAHLLGTSDPYGTPKPPHEYKWGDKVEVNAFDGWGVALYVAPTTDHGEHWCSTKKRPYNMSAFKTSDIRPLEPSND